MKFLLLLLALASATTDARSQTQQNVDYDQVRQDYRTYLRELKKLGAQYREFTGEMSTIMKEEGFPTWDETAGSPKVAEPGFVEGEGYSVKDEGKDIVVSLDVPGLKKDSIQVSLREQKILSVHGERKNGGALVERTIQLPVPVETKNPKARYEDGVLGVTLRKAQAEEVSIPVR